MSELGTLKMELRHGHWKGKVQEKERQEPKYEVSINSNHYTVDGRLMQLDGDGGIAEGQYV